MQYPKFPEAGILTFRNWNPHRVTPRINHCYEMHVIVYSNLITGCCCSKQPLNRYSNIDILRNLNFGTIKGNSMWYAINIFFFPYSKIIMTFVWNKKSLIFFFKYVNSKKKENMCRLYLWNGHHVYRDVIFY